EALLGSSVKISARDVLASWKVIVAAFAAPTLYALYALMYLIYIVRRRPTLSLRAKLTRSLLVWVVQPVLHYLLMRLGDSGLDIYKSIKPLFLAIRNPEAGEIIRSMRKELSKDITVFINKHAPELNNSEQEKSSTLPLAQSQQYQQQEQEQHISDDESSLMLDSSFMTTTTDNIMLESYLVSSRDEDESSASFLLDSVNEESTIFQVESIVLDEEE
ncbi:MAG: hypothetical protein EXX96DRAFT_480997, partial [Benjaminiella poitrasii]